MSLRSSLVVVFAAGSLATASLGQVGYGVNSAGSLFRFNLAAPNQPVTSIGNIGFVPEGIDFRPGTSTLYAIDVGPNVSQLYTIDINNGMASPVGGAFTSSGVGYDLTTSNSFGFDFNPSTLQADTSMRIRLVGTSGVNLRLHSATGQIAAVDTPLLYVGGNSPSVDAVAYTNSNVPTMGGATTLFDLDFRNNVLAIQNPANAGTLTEVGPFGLGITAIGNLSFDILTDEFDADPGIGGDRGYAVFRRADAPIGNEGEWVLYNVNLATGATTGGALVGIMGGNPSADFSGGLAVLIPSPSALLLPGLLLLGVRRRRAC